VVFFAVTGKEAGKLSRMKCFHDLSDVSILGEAIVSPACDPMWRVAIKIHGRLRYQHMVATARFDGNAHAHVTAGNGACRELIIKVIRVGAFDSMMATLDWFSGVGQGEILRKLWRSTDYDRRR
jgi:hypothetical protein